MMGIQHAQLQLTKPSPDTINAQDPHVGTDQWVAQIEGRRRQGGSLWVTLGSSWLRISPLVRYGVVLLLAALFPLLSGTNIVLDLLGISSNSFILRTGVHVLTFSILAVGLTAVVGYAGLLDLGYIAFMGLAGYLYAYMSSDFVQIGNLIPHGLAIPSIVSIPIIVVTAALIGYGIGAVSIRLSGDYLAIVTLGFGQVFLQLALTMTRVSVPGRERPVDFTHGPNGINNLDNISLFGYEIASTIQYYYLFLVLLVLVYITVTHLNRSRIGRAWRAIREDELAAEVMGIPTRRLKLLAFAVGAGIAALAGSVDAAFQGSVVPNPRYSVLALINLYAMVVLGGLGSLPGAVIGASIFTILPEILRSITLAGYLFYGALIIGLLILIRPWKRLILLLGSTILGGYLVKFLINVTMPSLDAGYPTAGSPLNMIVQGWLVIPTNYQTVGNVVTGAAVFLLLGALLLRNRFVLHNIVIGLTIYAFAFAWETTLVVNPSATRLLIVGLTLVILMIVRPQGLLGKKEAKIV
ncbi:branched-chain amino acid ABC transporter permease [Chloroflexi bacterium TSY]|nr:branched-chain amino acid ABC transporter permease [Chloroflexi bacterium TSY]